jgi:hypothetical protein
MPRSPDTSRTTPRSAVAEGIDTLDGGAVPKPEDGVTESGIGDTGRMDMDGVGAVGSAREGKGSASLPMEDTGGGAGASLLSAILVSQKSLTRS